MRLVILAGVQAIACLLTACATPDPPLSLVDRFEHVAFEPYEAGVYPDHLWRWEWPIRVEIVGSQDYRDLVAAHLDQLGKLTGVPVEMDSDRPNMTIEFSDRDPDWFCFFELFGRPGAYRAEIYIATDQHSRHIRRCIAQELSHAMGLLADTDGRRDTTFSSAIGTDYLTEADLALFRILYDHRLKPGMHRSAVMPIVRQIVAEMEAQQVVRQ